MQVGQEDVDPLGLAQIESERADPGAGVEDQVLAVGERQLHA